MLVVDDEAPARRRIADVLANDPHVASVRFAADGRSAVAMIREMRPDLVFLDVRMPELDGIGVIERIGPHRMPLTIFVTAYDRHALQAFEANALDYVLKPFGDERLEAALARALRRLDERRMSAFAENVLDVAAAARPRHLERFVVKTRATSQFVRANDVDWIEGDGVYVTLHVARKALLYRATLTYLARRLDPARFVRVHRSAIINIDAVVRLEAISHGEFEAVFADGTRARVSRTYRAALEERLGHAL